MVRPLLVTVTVLVLASSSARADDGAARLVKQCRAEPDGPLCREVRRACALKATRDEVTPACQELGWWGDTEERRIVNLCPIEPGHPDCAAMKERCEHGGPRDAAAEATCRAMGWIQLDDPAAGVRGGALGVGGGGEGSAGGGGTGADDDKPLSREQSDEVVRFCRSHPDAGPCQQLFTLCQRVGVGEPEDVRYVCGQLAGTGGGGAPGPGSAVTAPGGAGEEVSPYPPPLGLFAVDFQLGFYDDGGLSATDVVGADRYYGAWLHASRFGWRGHLIGGAAEVELGATSEGDVGYRARGLVGGGLWLGERAVLLGLVGVGAAGLDDGIPARLELPVRAQTFVYLGERTTFAAWAGVGLTRAIEDQAAEPPGVIGGADLVEGGVLFLWGGRPRGNIGAAAWSLGASYREVSGVRVFSLLLGFGQAASPRLP